MPWRSDTDSNSLRAQAHALHFAYGVGYISTNQIESWAERWIAVLEAPSLDLIELATIRSAYPTDVLNFLESVGGEPTSKEYSTIALGICGQLYQQGKLPLREALNFIWALHSETGLNDAERGMIYYLDDAYDLAMQGTYGSLDETEKEFCRFVQPYVEALPDAVRDMLSDGNQGLFQ